MKFGLLAYDWALANESPIEKVDGLLQQVRLARKVGFDSVLAGQHYLSKPYQMLQSVPLLARISAETGDMRIGTGILLLPLLNPVEVAEEVATLDILSRGRFIFGVGLGYRKEEFDAFGIEKRDAVPRLKEALYLVKQLWTNNVVNFEGRHFRIKDAQEVLKPVQKPYPPIWLAGDSDAAVVRAAELGDTWYANPHVSYRTLKRQVSLFKETCSRMNRPMPEELPVRRELYIAETQEEAYKLARPHLEAKYKVYHSWGQDRAVPEGEGFDRPFDELASDRFILGSPDTCIEQIDRLNKSVGFNHFILRVQWPGMKGDDATNAIHLLGERVLPYFR